MGAWPNRYPASVSRFCQVFAKTFGFWLWFWRSGSLSRSGQIARGTEISPLGGSRKDEAELFQNQNKQVCCVLPAIDDQEQSVNTRTSEDDELRGGWLLAMRCRNELSEAVA